MKHGPTRGEHRFRLIASLFGLALMVFAIVWRWDDLGGSVAVVEVVIFATAFFGGSAVWSGWKLTRRD